MIDNKTFNKKIIELENQEGSDVSNVIKLLKKTRCYNGDFCNFLDDFTFGLGLVFSNIPVYPETKDKLEGYKPTLIFHPDNVFQKESKKIELCLNSLDLKSSSKLLAKEVIYQIMQMKFDDLEDLVNKKYLN